MKSVLSLILIIIMQFSQSRVSSRGGLIAVLKIEIDHNTTDRIFLHQNDDDYRLAQHFIHKNHLNTNLVQHIYHKIAFSRQTVHNTTNNTPLSPTNHHHHSNHVPNNASAKQKAVVTPYQNLISQKQQRFLSQESFGFKKQLTHFQPEQEMSCNHSQARMERKDEAVEEILQQAPMKKMFSSKKEFLLYGENDSSQYDLQRQQTLFPNSQTDCSTLNNRQSTTKQKVAGQRQTTKHQRQQIKNKIFELLQQFDNSKDQSSAQPQVKMMAQFNGKSQRTRSKSVNNKNMGQEVVIHHSKPKHVKILIKEGNSQLSQSIKRQEISRINKDVTRRLYNEGQLKKHYLNIIKQKAKIEKDRLESVQLTHRPQINKISRMIASSRKTTDKPIELYLIEEGRKAQTKRQEQANRKYLKQIDNCTFEPQINLISQKLAEKNKDQSATINFKSKKIKYQDCNPFRPSLSKVTLELMKNKGSFENRQKQFLQLKHSKLVEKVKQKRLREKIDEITGQQLYRPKIHDIGVRENKGDKIGVYLYLLGKQSNPSQNSEAQFHPKINQTSELLVQQMHFKRISWLFAQLDHDQDGLISAHQISIDKIPSEILNIIKPILFQMQELNVELTLLQFKTAMEILHKKLGVSQRNCLYSTKTAKVSIR